MKYTVFLLISLFLGSCMNFTNEISGKYVRVGKGLNNQNELVLDANGTFTFSGMSCTNTYGTEGNWSKIKNNLLLNTFSYLRFTDTVSIITKGSIIKNTDSLVFFISDGAELIFGVYVVGFINDKIDKYSFSDTLGIAKLENKNYDSIHIYYPNYNSIKIIRKDSANYYNLTLKPEIEIEEQKFILSECILNEKWKITKKLYLNQTTKKICRKVVILDPRFKNYKKINAYIFKKN